MVELWFLSVQLHGLSRLSGAYSLVIVAATAACLLMHLRRRVPPDVFVWVTANVLVLGYVIWIDTFVSRALPSPGNIVRVTTPFAIAIVMALSVRSLTQVARLSIVYLAVATLGALSLYYQIAFGPVAWFADASSRSGVTRYATLLGSLTIFGTAAPFALLCLARYVKPAVPFAVGAVLLGVAAMFSLQKAAIAGMAIAAPFIVLLARPRGLFLTVGLSLIGGMTAIQLVPPQYLPYLEAGIRYVLREQSDDFSIMESIVDRLVMLPGKVVDFVGWDSLIAGAGLRGAGGVFGFDDLPMAHNGLVDYVAVGGVLFFAYGTWVCARVAWFGISLPWMVRRQLMSRDDALFLGGMALLYLANLPFASGVQFHPNISWVFAMIIAVQMALRESVQDERIGQLTPSGQAAS